MTGRALLPVAGPRRIAGVLVIRGGCLFGGVDAAARLIALAAEEEFNVGMRPSLKQPAAPHRAPGDEILHGINGEGGGAAQGQRQGGPIVSSARAK
jgi:hypothetical protein